MGIFDQLRNSTKKENFEDLQGAGEVGGLVTVGGSDRISRSQQFTDSRQFRSSTDTRISTSEQFTDARVFSPSISVVRDSPNATQISKKEAKSQAQQATPTDLSGGADLSGAVRGQQSAVPDQSGGQSQSLIGGSSGSLLVLGAVGVGGFILIQRFT